MKAYLMIGVVALLVVEACYGQGITVRSGSPEAAAMVRGAWQDAQLYEFKRTKRIESGRYLFGVDERWTAAFDSKGKSDKLSHILVFSRHSDHYGCGPHRK